MMPFLTCRCGGLHDALSEVALSAIILTFIGGPSGAVRNEKQFRLHEKNSHCEYNCENNCELYLAFYFITPLS